MKTKVVAFVVAALVLATLALGAGRAEAWVPETSDPVALTGAVSTALNAYWSATFTEAGRTYVAPRPVRLYMSSVATQGCGRIPAQNAAYCAANRTIYVHRGLLRRLIVSADADFAAGTIIAHEWGHHVQDRLGWLRWATTRRYFAGVELQADCYAGMFAGYAERQGLLSEGDLDEAAALMLAIGDEPGVRPNSRGAHGTAEQRLEWFRVGYESGTLAACDAVYVAVHGSGATRGS